MEKTPHSLRMEEHSGASVASHAVGWWRKWARGSLGSRGGPCEINHPVILRGPTVMPSTFAWGWQCPQAGSGVNTVDLGVSASRESHTCDHRLGINLGCVLQYPHCSFKEEDELGCYSSLKLGTWQGCVITTCDATRRWNNSQTRKGKDSPEKTSPVKKNVGEGIEHHTNMVSAGGQVLQEVGLSGRLTPVRWQQMGRLDNQFRKDNGPGVKLQVTLRATCAQVAGSLWTTPG